MAALALAVFLVHPILGMGFNDDWSYIWSVRAFANTGHVEYNGWGAMPLGWQLPLGALFVKLFGFSFNVARFPVFLVALATAGLLQRILVRCGLSQTTAMFGTLALTLNPLFLPLSYTFMTDIPALFCMFVCFWACLRAFSAETSRAAIGWLVFAALSNDLLGTVRQVVWLGVLVMVPCAAWCMRRRHNVLPAVAGVWVLSAGLIAAALHWFKTRPYTIYESLIAHGDIIHFRQDVHCVLAMLFCGIAMLTIFLVAYPYRQLTARQRRIAGATAGVFLLAIFLFSRTHPYWVAPFSYDFFTGRGVEIPHTLLGVRPAVIPFSLQVVLSVFTAAALFATVLFFVLPPAENSAYVAPRVSTRDLCLMLLPYSAVYLALILTRRDIFDRYFSPLLFVATLLLLRAYTRRSSGRIPMLAFAVMALLAIFTTASTHDLFATSRARLDAANQLRAAGITRPELNAGLEYDGWTELEQAGYINNPRLMNPPGAYRYTESRKMPYACDLWYLNWMPALESHYLLSYEPLYCMSKTSLGPFPYRTWLSPRTRYLYVVSFPPGTSKN